MKKSLSLVLTICLMLSLVGSLGLSVALAAPQAENAWYFQANTNLMRTGAGAPLAQAGTDEVASAGGDSGGKYATLTADTTSFTFDIKLDPAKELKNNNLIFYLQTDLTNLYEAFTPGGEGKPVWYSLQEYDSKLFIHKRGADDATTGNVIGDNWGQATGVRDGQYHTVTVQKTTVEDGVHFEILLDGVSVYSQTDTDPIDFSARKNVTPAVFTSAPAGAVTLRTTRLESYNKGKMLTNIHFVDFAGKTMQVDSMAVQQEQFADSDYSYNNTNGEVAYTYKMRIDEHKAEGYFLDFYMQYNQKGLTNTQGRGCGISFANLWFGDDAVQAGGKVYVAANGKMDYLNADYSAALPSTLLTDGQFHTYTAVKSARTANGEVMLSLYIDGRLALRFIDSAALDVEAHTAALNGDGDPDNDEYFRGFFEMSGVKVTFMDPRTDTSLTSIKVNGETAQAGGTVTVANSVTSAQVEATAADPDAAVSVSGAEELQVGSNTVTIRVTAADGVTTQEYTITIIRQEEGEPDDDVNPVPADGKTYLPAEADGWIMTAEGDKASYADGVLTIAPPSDITNYQMNGVNKKDICVSFKAAFENISIEEGQFFELSVRNQSPSDALWLKKDYFSLVLYAYKEGDAAYVKSFFKSCIDGKDEMFGFVDNLFAISEGSVAEAAFDFSVITEGTTTSFILSVNGEEKICVDMDVELPAGAVTINTGHCVTKLRSTDPDASQGGEEEDDPVHVTDEIVYVSMDAGDLVVISEPERLQEQDGKLVIDTPADFFEAYLKDVSKKDVQVRFKVKFDDLSADNLETFFQILLRNQDPAAPAWHKGSYYAVNFCMMYDEHSDPYCKAIITQSGNGTDKMLQIVDKVFPVADKSTQEMEVAFSAVNTDDGVVLQLFIDGVEVMNYLETETDLPAGAISLVSSHGKATISPSESAPADGGEDDPDEKPVTGEQANALLPVCLLSFGGMAAALAVRSRKKRTGR